MGRLKGAAAKNRQALRVLCRFAQNGMLSASGRLVLPAPTGASALPYAGAGSIGGARQCCKGLTDVRRLCLRRPAGSQQLPGGRQKNDQLGGQQIARQPPAAVGGDEQIVNGVQADAGPSVPTVPASASQRRRNMYEMPNPARMPHKMCSAPAETPRISRKAVFSAPFSVK